MEIEGLMHCEKHGIYWEAEFGENCLVCMLPSEKQKADSKKMTFDAKFHAFQQLAKLLDVLFPKGYQLTIEQGDAVHACAKKLAADLTSGGYV